MTITYSLDVANTRFCGFAKLLGRWKGSIYKILWKELLVFTIGYSLLSVTYRVLLNEGQKRSFEHVVIYFETFIDLIPLSFVLGFYVSLVIGRWWSQYDTIPWPDRLCYMIAAYVHGADERSRMIRRTLGRYLILMQALTCQSVSTSVKKRFPSTQHLVASGIMTKEERTVYENLDAPYGKWWLPALWFSGLVMRAKKEGRIKDSILEDGLFREFCLYRSACGMMFSYDWISVPLVYTQVVTLATYTYSVALMVGRQYLDPEKDYKNHQVDMYVPVFTLLQFFFYMGWLKVAEQIVNPYGEDDDDFELNWCLDRNCQVVYLIVDHFHTKHPKLRKDKFWDEMLPELPQTKITAKYVKNPQLGSAFNMEVDPADSEFLPMDTLLEEDNEANVYSSDSMKHANGVRYRPSFLMNILNSNFGQNTRKRSMQKTDSFKDQWHVNPAYTINMERSAPPRGSMPITSRKSSLAKKSPAHSRASSISFNPSSISRHRHKSYDFQQAETTHANGHIAECEGNGIFSTMAAAMAPVVANFEDESDSNHMEEDTGYQKTESYMPAIPEEPSRPISMVSTEPQCQELKTNQRDDVQNLVAEASKVLEELNKVVTSQGHRKDCASKDYKSCCSLEMSEASTEEDDIGSNRTPVEMCDNIDKSPAVIEIGEIREEEDLSSHDSRV
ncbi:bestrophin-4-like [Uloborus diversus]|uniref:bestrophin-4-like n=1 Tax=Uloborus diversus TaxID=327109 RepID=UPI002409CCC8|nr:bestrophin-4-like [Uloborus diversus]